MPASLVVARVGGERELDLRAQLAERLQRLAVGRGRARQLGHHRQAEVDRGLLGRDVAIGEGVPQQHRAAGEHERDQERQHRVAGRVRERGVGRDDRRLDHAHGVGRRDRQVGEPGLERRQLGLQRGRLGRVGGDLLEPVADLDRAPLRRRERAPALDLLEVADLAREGLRVGVGVGGRGLGVLRAAGELEHQQVGLRRHVDLAVERLGEPALALGGVDDGGRAGQLGVEVRRLQQLVRAEAEALGLLRGDDLRQRVGVVALLEGGAGEVGGDRGQQRRTPRSRSAKTRACEVAGWSPWRCYRSNERIGRSRPVPQRSPARPPRARAGTPRGGSGGRSRAAARPATPGSRSARSRRTGPRRSARRTARPSRRRPRCRATPPRP